MGKRERTNKYTETKDWATRIPLTKMLFKLGKVIMQANTNTVNKTWSLLQTTGGQDEQNIVEIIHQSWYPMR
jgi:hypothetical protein